MMPQEEINAAMRQQADAEFGRYEGTQARQNYEPSYEQAMREGSSGKVYPLPRDNANVFRFALVLIALGLIVLFGLLFIFVIGGTTGWASLAVVCFAIMVITGFGLEKIH
jgi:hypothetical protein